MDAGKRVARPEADRAVSADEWLELPGREPPAPGLGPLAVVDGQELLSLVGGDDDGLTAEARRSCDAVRVPRPAAGARPDAAQRDRRVASGDMEAGAVDAHADALGGPPCERNVRHRSAEPLGEERLTVDAAAAHCLDGDQRGRCQDAGKQAEDGRLPQGRPSSVLCERRCSRGPQILLVARHFLVTFSPLRVGTGIAGRYEFRMRRRNHSSE